MAISLVAASSESAQFTEDSKTQQHPLDTSSLGIEKFHDTTTTRDKAEIGKRRSTTNRDCSLLILLNGGSDIKYSHLRCSHECITRSPLGQELYLEAIKLLKYSDIQEEDHVFIPQSSSLVRSFLSDELQKQKGILPTSLRLVTQGFMSFFRSTPTSSPTEPEDKHDAPRTTPKKHRDPSIAKAMDLLRKAGDDYGNDDALWTLANIYFVS